MQKVKWYMVRCLVGGMLGSAAVIQPAAAGQPAAYTQEHAITIDATPINPQSWWQVPGITPSIYASDPESMDAYKTTESRALKLKPGKYKFGSFTFDFPFTVNLDGPLQPDLSVWRPARLPVSVEERYQWPKRLMIS
jgi:hypothetical protein